MLRGVQANVAQRRALSQLYQAKEVAPGTVDVVSDITLWPKPSCIPQREWGPRHKPGLDQLKQGHEAAQVTLPYGILEERRTFDVRSYHWVDFRKVPKV